MKRLIKRTHFALYILLTAVLFTACDNVKVGQEWHYIINKNNPYEKPIIKKQVVIGVANGYVQYIENDKDTLSCSVSWFKLGNERQKHCR